MVYRLDSCSLSVRELAARLDGEPAADVVLFTEDGFAVARRDGEELRFRPAGGGWEAHGDPDVLDESRYPNGLERAWHALAGPNAGEVLVSAREGFEFVDLGGRAHVGGGSHGSLVAGDSVIPLVAAGFDEPPFREGSKIIDVAPAALRFLGVTPPETMAVSAAAPANVSAGLSDACAGPWSTSSCAAAASATCACSTRWAAFRARSSWTRTTGATPTRTCPC